MIQFKLDNNDFISLRIIRKVKIKYIYLRVTQEGIFVSANKKTKLCDIESFVYSKSAWLRKHLKVQEQKKQKQLLVTGNKFYFQGTSYVLECQEKENIKKPILELLENRFIIQMLKETTEEELQFLFDTFYKKEAITQITLMVEKWSKIMNLKPKNISFRKAKRRWGSCSSQDSLSFNYYLMKLPLYIIEYVVVHELAHIKEKNHSINFWALVEKFLPNYKELVKELREFESLI